MGRRRLPPKLKISKFEANILAYPPNVDSWICFSEICEAEGGIMNGGTRNTCWVCAQPHSDTSVFAWPLYVAACEKVNITPGEELWSYNYHLGRAVVRPVAGGHWEVWETDEPIRLEVASRR